MMDINYFGVVKEQLWGYYRQITDMASILAEEYVGVNLFTGERQRVLMAPVGLRDELVFTKDEIELWMQYERDLKDDVPVLH